ncbi:MAG: molecular chaperone HtpG [Deltaproteobacteria bacterium]|nr:molecular chaperone HtpG [Deltaproteobacteria bacterium]
MSEQKHTFTAEVQELLHLMVHSLYSNKDIFLRELISNSSDALDKLRLLGITQKELLPNDELHIRLELNKDNKTLTIHDNGIGMSRDDLIKEIGTIAHSGTQSFLATMKERAQNQTDNANAAPDLIGQFGVGFYSTFMVAKKVTIITRRAGEDTATKWESTGDGTYTIDDAQKSETGTIITLALKDVDEEDGLKDYTDPWVIKDIVKKHSDFVSYPIRMMVEHQEPVLDDKGKIVENTVPKIIKKDEVLNSMKAIWTRPRSEVKDEEYKEFYHHITHDYGDPLEIITANMEGNFSARLLLFIPPKAPFDLYYRDKISKGVQLYVKRVFILDDWKALLPEWLRFVKGVIDSEDLSLNVSREILQQDRQIQAIKKFAVKKVLDAIENIKSKRPDDMKKLWQEFGPVLKEGLTLGDKSGERILEFMLCQSTNSNEPTFLNDYVERMPEKQEGIYYLAGSSLDVLKGSPHLEAFKAKSLEVLLFTDPIDQFWLQSHLAYKDKKFIPIDKGAIDLEADADKEVADKTKKEMDEAHYKDLLQCLRSHLQDDIKEVRLSGRLTDSAACLVGDTHDLTPQMEEIMQRLGQQIPKTKRILELNRNHPFIEKLHAIHATDPKANDLEIYAKLLYGQAVLAEGGKLANPGAYSRLIMDVATKAAAN